MPAFFVGASGIFVRADLDLSEAQLGLAIAAFFAASAVLSAPGGRITEWIGASRILQFGVLCSAGVMLSIAFGATQPWHLAALLAIGGAINGVTSPATNLALAHVVIARPALMFSMKQAAIPVATLLAGASVPLIAVHVGWRVGFAAGATLAVPVAVLIPPRLKGTGRRVARLREGDAAPGLLIALAVAVGVGTSTVTALAAFLVEAAAVSGLSVSVAGWLLVVGSISGIVSRLVSGWVADRVRGTALYIVAGMLIAGASGFVLLSLGGLLMVPGALIAYAFGWGWTGLVMFAVVRTNPNAPGAATGIVQTGAATGAAAGPLAFGWIVGNWSYAAGWSVTAGAALVSGVLVLVTRHHLARDYHRRLAHQRPASAS